MATIVFTETRRHGTYTGSDPNAGAAAVAEISGISAIRFRNHIDGGHTGATDYPLIRPGGGAGTNNWSFNKFIDVTISGIAASGAVSSVKVQPLNIETDGEVDAGTEVYLYYAFQRKGSVSGVALTSADFDQVVDGSSAQPSGISGASPSPAVWSNAVGTQGMVDWGGMTGSITSADNGKQFSVISSEQASAPNEGDEYLCLQLNVRGDEPSGGALSAFSLQLSYNEV